MSERFTEIWHRFNKYIYLLLMRYKNDVFVIRSCCCNCEDYLGSKLKINVICSLLCYNPVK